MNLLDVRRRAPRVTVDGFVGVASDHDLVHAEMTDLSLIGLRMDRVFDPATASPVVQLEIELPGIDEVVWTSAYVTRAHLSPLPGRDAHGNPRFWCRAGLRIGDCAGRERRMLRDYVIERLISARSSAARA